jgi:putative peptidoglycan lipid II flippase
VAGSVAALQRAWFILLLPQGLIAQSVATAVFPTFSAQAARGEQEELKRTLGQVLRTVLFLAIPAAIGLVLLRLPIVQILYERGEFTAQDSQATAWALMFFGFGLIAHALVEIITRAFYALHDTRTPVLIGGGAMLLNVILSLTFIRWIGEPGALINGPFGGLALANSIATTLEGIALLLFINPRVGGLEGKKLGMSIGRACLAGLVMGLFIWQLLPLASRSGGLYFGIFGLILAAGALFWGVSLLLKSEEARLFTAFAVKRLKRGA